MRTWIEQQWQRTGWAHSWLIPLSWLFTGLSALRRYLYRKGVLSSQALPVPVIVVGNLSVGGVGKTPLVLWLAQQLLLAGYRPGIISRGYGGKQTGRVCPESDPRLLGDEPVLLARRSQCPVWVHPRRVEAGLALLHAEPACNVLICDDGLQHYALRRDIELCVMRRPEGIGNGRRLPAGPLREDLHRSRTVDAIIETGQLPAVFPAVPTYHMQLQTAAFQALDQTRTATAAMLAGLPLLAVAGIGHPERFFDTLTALGLIFETRVFADHHAYRTEDFAGLTEKTILMTEKDAVKCRQLGLSNAWYLPVEATITPLNNTQPLLERVLSQLQTRKGSLK